MRWTPGGESQDIEDRRDESGGGGGFQFGGMHIGIGGAIILLILSFVFKTNLFTLLSGGGADSGPATVRQPNPARDAAERPLVEFVFPSFSTTRRKHGRNFFPSRRQNRIGTQSSCSSATTRDPVAAERNRPLGLSTARKTKGFTSTSGFSMS